MEIEPISLLELNKKISKIINEYIPDNYWIVAEISEIKEQYGGHCYLELIEKGKNDKIVARARAIIWSSTFRILKPYFQTTTGQSFIAGLKILVNVSVDFHELYGYNLIIRNIKPEYTIGEIEIKRRQTIKRLSEEGIINMNREIEMPPIIKTIAIISSQTAAGYEDFEKHLKNNANGFIFHTKLFPSLMQGEDAIISIINALEKIYMHENIFDVVVIIRGGGATADLSCFDDYNLACHIAQFPLPIVTGIGHEKDETIADIVANTSLKTPTATADFIVEHNNIFYNNIINYITLISENISALIEAEKQQIIYLSGAIQNRIKISAINRNKDLSILNQKIKNVFLNQINNKKRNLELIKNKSINLSNKYFSISNKKLEFIIDNCEKNVKSFFIKNEERICKVESLSKALNYENILSRGFTITLKNDKIITSVQEIYEGDEITTIHKTGKIRSTVKK